LALTIGSRVGVYEVSATLGAGGMGEVYRARDTKLDRDVALKILPDSFAADPERAARFQREAKALAALNHPNVGAIYGMETEAGVTALVLELVEGPTLADRIVEGPIPLSEALPIARQIADALDAAHEQGIVHRDLKPSNIKLRPDGTVKVLDFGLARAMSTDASGSAARALSMSPTITTPAAMTGMGMILGTAAYMSPEQARGKAVDKRADIWAFGVVLFEMLTGHRPFGGEEMSDVFASVLAREPDLARLPKDLPESIRQVLRVCLQKDPKLRARDIGDVRMMMDGAFHSTAPVQETAAPRRATWQRAAGWIAAGLIVGGAAVGAAVWALPPREAPRVARFLLDTPEGLAAAFRDTVASDIAISPDGTRVVYTGGPSGFDLLVRPVDRLDTTLLARQASNPFMSPDSGWVGYVSSGTWQKVSVTGGPPVTLWKNQAGPSRGASWGPDDTIVFSTQGSTGLFRGPAAGGTPAQLTKTNVEKGELGHWWPEVLPGGRAVLFTIVRNNLNAENMEIAVLDLASGAQKTLVRGGSHPRYASGYIVYGVAGTLRAVSFDIDRLEVAGDPAPVVEGVLTKQSGAADFSLASDGTLVYVAADAAVAAQRALVWVDRKGQEQPIAKAPLRAYTYLRISPDGAKVALDVRDEQNDIWTWDFARETPTRLTFDPGLDRAPIWSPDGRRIAFSSQREGGIGNLFWQAADGTGRVEKLSDLRTQQFPTSFSPDGTKLLFWEVGSETAWDMGVVGLQDDRKATGLLKTSFNELNPEVSPDGKWLAYQSDESGQYEVYVRPFPNVEDSGKWQVSNDGGTRPVWSRNGRDLFYLVEPGRVMTVPIQPGPTFTYGNAQMVFDGPYLAPNAARTYDVSPDGKRFLMIKEAPRQGNDPAPEPKLVLIQNWVEELKRLVPK
jgi:serine/threonine-protein kinase